MEYTPEANDLTTMSGVGRFLAGSVLAAGLVLSMYFIGYSAVEIALVVAVACSTALYRIKIDDAPTLPRPV